MSLRSLHLFALALVIACGLGARPVGAQAPQANAPPAVREYSGRYLWGFEQSQFSACGVPSNDRPWWVTLSDRALAQRDSALAALDGKPSFPVFVRWRGVAGDRGRVGHLGGHTRYFTAYELLELRPSRPDDCKGLSL